MYAIELMIIGPTWHVPAPPAAPICAPAHGITGHLLSSTRVFPSTPAVGRGGAGGTRGAVTSTSGSVVSACCARPVAHHNAANVPMRPPATATILRIAAPLSHRLSLDGRNFF